MLQYPSKLDYDNAVWNLSKTSRCSEFQDGVARNNGFDLTHYTGGFSRVYLIDNPDRPVILRVWLNEIQNVKSLYTQAEKFFKGKSNPYFVDFLYIQNGIEVNQQVWPILFMEWVDGLTLNQFLDDSLPNSPQKVEAVADQFLKMTNNLHQEGISHGDLQDGNIIVTKHLAQTGLKLIDYDTLHIPGFNDTERQVVGVSGYQHPRRAGQDVDKQKWDYFSELVIYLSLRAYSERPQLWKLNQEKALLFSKADFNDPENSPVFKTLNSMSVEVRRMSDQLVAYCHETDQNQLQPLQEVVFNIQQEEIQENHKVEIINLVSSKIVSEEQKGRYEQNSKDIRTLKPDTAFRNTEAQSVITDDRLLVESKPSSAKDKTPGRIITISIAGFLLLVCIVMLLASNIFLSSGGDIPPNTTKENTPVILSSPTISQQSNPTQYELPTPTSTVIYEPQDFAQWYFTTVWRDRNYSTLWENYLTTSFQNHSSSGNFKDYADWWGSVKKIDIKSIDVIENDGQSAWIHIKMTFYLNDGRVLSNREYDYDLIFNSDHNTWMFDYHN